MNMSTTQSLAHWVSDKQQWKSSI